MQRGNKRKDAAPENDTSAKRSGNGTYDRYEAAQASTQAARMEAMHDIEQDADLSIHSPNDDLDEGETARLGEDRTDLI
ncbi:hypothetical protein V9K67_13780 [Paraflavisolibacter sp. H34]|uniref:hypothetical protein n=1 Tax=Huijunlia imazamoxiresistens TaxID=3127457 RepID=UPI00301766F4